jgi:hypothetical protein
LERIIQKQSFKKIKKRAKTRGAGHFHQAKHNIASKNEKQPTFSIGCSTFVINLCSHSSPFILDLLSLRGAS